MSMVRARAGVVLLLCAFATLPAVADAATHGRGVRVVRYPITRASLSLTVAFHGDPRVGCDRLGECGSSGTTTITASSHHGATPNSAFLVAIGPLVAFDAGFSAFAHTSETLSQPTASPCRDTIYYNRVQFTLQRAAGRNTSDLVLSVSDPLGAGAHSDALATHCAGPRLADLAPGPIFPIHLQSGSRPQGLRLTQTQTFARDGFAGTATSTVEIFLDRPVAV